MQQETEKETMSGHTIPDSQAHSLGDPIGRLTRDINITFCSDVNFSPSSPFPLKWTFSFNGRAQQKVSTAENTSDKMQGWKAVQSSPNLGVSTGLKYDTVQLS